jgi:hypothetical protein
VQQGRIKDTTIAAAWGCPSYRVAHGIVHNSSHPAFLGYERPACQGDGVTTNNGRSYTSARGVARLAGQLSERDLGIIRQVAELRLMSARQIQTIHFPSSHHDNESAATHARQRVLARLTRERLLIRLDRQIGGVRAGSAGFVFALGPIGQRVLAIDGPRRRSYEPTLRFVDHTLAVSQLVVDVQTAARAGRLEILNSQAEPACWRDFSNIGGRRLLRPDAFMVLGAQEYELRWFIEVDRSSESLPVIVRKCRLYADYYQSGKEQASGGVFPRVCWITPDEARADRLREAIERDRKLPGRLFVVTTSEQAVTALSTATEVAINT